MNKYLSYLHDLNNKLMILYSLLRCRKNENQPSEDKIIAVKDRINEIVKSLHTEFQFELDQSLVVSTFSMEDFNSYLSLATSKLRRIYTEVWITYEININETNKNFKMKLDKNLLSQALENAVENSRNANALLVEFRVYQNEDLIFLDICDNGGGFKATEKKDRLLPEASGVNIIKENMRLMGGRAEYNTNPQNGVTLALVFPVVVG